MSSHFSRSRTHFGVFRRRIVWGKPSRQYSDSGSWDISSGWSFTSRSPCAKCPGFVKPGSRQSRRCSASSRNEGVWDTGSLIINANRVGVLSNGAITAQTNRGQGGDIQINSRSLILREGGSIVAAVSGTGDGGNTNLI